MARGRSSRGRARRGRQPSGVKRRRFQTDEDEARAVFEEDDNGTRDSAGPSIARVRHVVRADEHGNEAVSSSSDDENAPARRLAPYERLLQRLGQRADGIESSGPSESDSGAEEEYDDDYRENHGRSLDRAKSDNAIEGDTSSDSASGGAGDSADDSADEGPGGLQEGVAFSDASADEAGTDVSSDEDGRTAGGYKGELDAATNESDDGAWSESDSDAERKSRVTSGGKARAKRRGDGAGHASAGAKYAAAFDHTQIDDASIAQCDAAAASGFCDAVDPTAFVPGVEADVRVTARRESVCVSKPPVRLAEIGIKRRIAERLAAGSGEGDIDRVASAQVLGEAAASYFNLVQTYADVVHTCANKDTPFDSLGDAMVIHAVNHVVTARDRVLKNNERLRAEGDKEARDQGFTRARVLILVPTRHFAKLIVERMVSMLPEKLQIENKARFFEEFGDDDAIAARTGSRLDDFNAAFGANGDDCFRVGIALSRKALRLYVPFYGADLLIASPLGLRLITGAEGDRRREYDFLSSVELCWIHRADVMAMQNFEHVRTVVHALNKTPLEDRGTDFARVREYILAGAGASVRQTVLTSIHPLPEVNALVREACRNARGAFRIRQARFGGSIRQVVAPARQTFRRIPLCETSDDGDVRFSFFCSEILPQLQDVGGTPTLLFVPSYFDFVRLRNHFREEMVSFSACSEYTEGKDIARARTRFFNGIRQIMLYTERFHFFRRYTIRGAHRIVFYGLPQHAHFYTEVVNFLGSVPEASCIALFANHDALALERIVGTSAARRMIRKQHRSVFTYC